MRAETRCFRYSLEYPQGRIFEKDEEIPDGYFDHPKLVKKSPPKKKRGRPRKNERQ